MQPPLFTEDSDIGSSARVVCVRQYRRKGQNGMSDNKRETAAILYLVLPCYNEEEVLHSTAEQLKKKYADLMDSGKISRDSKIMFVNDGS